MTESTTSGSRTPSLSTLPPELLGKILTQELPEYDLAQCCLVSRQFSQISRSALYSDVDCIFLPTPASNKMEPSSFKLLQTLRISSSARQFLKSLRFDVYDEGQWDSWDEMVAEAVEVPSFDEIIVEILNLAPQVTRLTFRRVVAGKASDYVHSHRDRWTELDIPELAIGVGPLTAGGTFNNLRKLSCSLVFSPATGNRIYLPPNLEMLDLDETPPALVTIENASTSSLCFLRLEFKSLVNLPDIAKLPHLQHLYLECECPIPVEDPSTIANILNPLGGLVSLSFSYWRGWEFDPTPAYISTLLRHLDLPIRRLDFESWAPLVDLANLLKSDHFKTVRTLGLAKYHVREEFPKQDLAVLSQVCEDKGISIEEIEPMFRLFCESF
ncbi:hypothetical protein JCM5350_001351 [Sporobolomyces pararoseus]